MRSPAHTTLGTIGVHKKPQATRFSHTLPQDLSGSVLAQKGLAAFPQVLFADRLMHNPGMVLHTWNPVWVRHLRNPGDRFIKDPVDLRGPGKHRLILRVRADGERGLQTVLSRYALCGTGSADADISTP